MVATEMKSLTMKSIRVVCAIIQRDGRILATQRGYGEFEGGWEFPGGKIEDHETPVNALQREIFEELEARIEVGDKLLTVEYDYPSFHLSMDCFLCSLVNNHLELLEHEAAKWLDASHLDDVDWLPADKEIVEKLKHLLTSYDELMSK